MERIICLVIGYACGLLQTGYLVGKMHHIDIRKAGSGNSGSTNALRVLGLKAGLMTFRRRCIEVCSAAVLHRPCNIPVEAICLPLLDDVCRSRSYSWDITYPFYMNFKGGKGIAVMAGLVLYQQVSGICRTVPILYLVTLAFLSCAVCM